MNEADELIDGAVFNLPGARINAATIKRANGFFSASGYDASGMSQEWWGKAEAFTPSTLSDTDLLAEFHRVEWMAGEPVHEELVAEVKRRELDF